MVRVDWTELKSWLVFDDEEWGLFNIYYIVTNYTSKSIKSTAVCVDKIEC